ncbi:MAG: sll0787 family AIR synthase-like protein [Cyanobacteria bacterium P01_G01_bin.54]
MQLTQLATQLRQTLGIAQKQDIQLAAQYLPSSTEQTIRLGDDCAAIRQGDRYLLLAAEGLLPHLVTAEPWFAGWCAVMVNVSDIYAMGGEPIAVVDTLWSPSKAAGQALWQGMQAAAQAYHVPIVGGHTNCHSDYTALSVAILGQAEHLITSFDAQPGDVLLMAIDLRGQPYKQYPFWNAATMADPQRLQGDLALLPQIAAAGWCRAGKDISMGGVLGTALMLLETSGCGAVIDLDKIPQPANMDLLAWLQHFPSFGFLLAVQPAHVEQVCAAFAGRGLVCGAIGQVDASPALKVRLRSAQCQRQSGSETVVLWDWTEQPLMGFR